MRYFGILILIMLTCQSTQAGEIRRWVDDQGQVHFGDLPPANVQKTEVVEVAPINSLAVPSSGLASSLAATASPKPSAKGGRVVSVKNKASAAPPKPKPSSSPRKPRKKSSW